MDSKYQPDMEISFGHQDWLDLVDQIMGIVPEKDSVSQLAVPTVNTDALLVASPPTNEAAANMITPSPSTSSSSFSSQRCSILTDLKGTTAYAARNMTPEERQFMLLKRKLRNRESARRSKAKRESQLQSMEGNHTKLLKEIEQLKLTVHRLIAEGELLKQENDYFRATMLGPKN